MRSSCTWVDKLSFVSRAGAHTIPMDAKEPLGSGGAPTPKDLVLAALCGCAAMDVISLLRKHQEPVEKFSVDAEAAVRASQPASFSGVHLIFRLQGNIRPERAEEAVRLSQTKFCSVSAMLSKAVPIHYSIELNGTEINRGAAAFDVHFLEPGFESA